ncbi:hypothetical protein ACFXTN_018589 [Malus domestica]
MTLSKFEDLRMLEFETFLVFYEKIEILTNEALGLGKPIDETTFVQKILRCLPKRFQANKATIQEFQDLNEIKLGKLVGKLIIYGMELDMDESDSKKRKEVALQGVENCEVVGDVCRHALEDDLALFDNQFRRILKNKGNDSKWVGESSNSWEKQSAGVKHKGFTRKVDKGLSKVPSPCFACGGSRHHAAKCANTKFLEQKHEKEVSPSDDDTVLNDSEEITYDELCIKYDTLFDEIYTTKVEKMELTKKFAKLQKKNKSLRLVIFELDEKIGYLETRVEELNRKKSNFNDKDEKDDDNCCS